MLHSRRLVPPSMALVADIERKVHARKFVLSDDGNHMVGPSSHEGQWVLVVVGEWALGVARWPGPRTRD